MRKTLLFCAVAVSSLALGGPVFAQDDQTQTHSTQPTTTSSTSSSATVTGTVVSSSDNELVIDTATGRQRFVVVSGTSDIPSNLSAGTQVTVEFRTSGDQHQVARVTASPRGGASSTSSSSAMPPSSTTSSTTPSPADPTLGAQATRDADRDADVTTDIDRDRRAGVADTDADPDGDDALPATASPLGLVGLFGLLSLGASAALRAWRRLS